MNPSSFRQLYNAAIVPVLKLEPVYMFDDVDKGPETREGLQALFREIASHQKIASVNFLPGTDLLVPVRSLFDHLDDLAEIFSYDVHTPVDTELGGGYAFIENGVYLFGVEDGATISDAIEWELSIEQLNRNKHAVIRHSCNYPFEACIKDEQVVLWNKRDAVQYAMPFKDYRSEIRKAIEELKAFALAFVPIYAAKLNIPDPYEAAMWNFNKHHHWFEEQGVLVQ